MKVTMLTKRDTLGDLIDIAAQAMLICHSNPKVKTSEQMMSNAINMGHESILEHINISFLIEDLSRACLQELARHRHISLSVQSTRHTLLKQLRDKEWLENFTASLNLHQQALVNYVASLASHADISNDELKYYIPEFWPTNLILTANVRELRYLMKLRSQPAALKEFQDLVFKICIAVPEEYSYLFRGCICGS